MSGRPERRAISATTPWAFHAHNRHHRRHGRWRCSHATFAMRRRPAYCQRCWSGTEVPRGAVMRARTAGASRRTAHAASVIVVRSCGTTRTLLRRQGGSHPSPSGATWPCALSTASPRSGRGIASPICPVAKPATSSPDRSLSSHDGVVERCTSDVLTVQTRPPAEGVVPLSVLGAIPRRADPLQRCPWSPEGGAPTLSLRSAGPRGGRVSHRRGLLGIGHLVVALAVVALVGSPVTASTRPCPTDFEGSRGRRRPRPLRRLGAEASSSTSG